MHYKNLLCFLKFWETETSHHHHPKFFYILADISGREILKNLDILQEVTFRARKISYKRLLIFEEGLPRLENQKLSNCLWHCYP